MRLPVAELEPRLTEFQLVEDPDGNIVGGIGLQVGSNHGRLHSEGFTDFSFADAGREALWNRVQTLSTNHGILRLWTLEDTLFWRQRGFRLASAEELKKLPTGWNLEGASWLTLQLKDEEAITAAEKEMALFMSSQKRRTEELTSRVGAMKKLITFLAIILVILIFGAAIYMIVQHPEILHLNR